MDLTHWFGLITVAGAVMGMLAAIQQLLIHGLKPFVHAIFITFGVGMALAMAYPHIQWRTPGGATQALLSINATPPQSTATGPAPLKTASLGLTTVNRASNPVESALEESKSADQMALAPITSPSAFKPTEPALVELRPINPAPPTSRASPQYAAVPTERAAAMGVKPKAPALLPAQQKFFWPAEVASCPACFCAYSSKGPIVDVHCPHCARKVNLVSNPDYIVCRCGTCGKAFRTTIFPPIIGPYLFRYYCPYCKDHHWFLD